MYNSSIKGQSNDVKMDAIIEIPNQVFFNDMSKNHICEVFKTCDVIFSEIAWNYGYKGFNENAGNTPASYTEYLNNIQKLICELGVPAFIVAGKPAAKHFNKAKRYQTKINTSGTNMSGCQLYVWNYDYDGRFSDTKSLIEWMTKTFRKCLDFSCGYGEHLLGFEDFIGCDINRNCLTYLSILKAERDAKRNGTASGG